MIRPENLSNLPLHHDVKHQIRESPLVPHKCTKCSTVRWYGTRLRSFRVKNEGSHSDNKQLWLANDEWSCTWYICVSGTNNFGNLWVLWVLQYTVWLGTHAQVVSILLTYSALLNEKGLNECSFKYSLLKQAHCISVEKINTFLRPLEPTAQFSLFQKAKFKRAFVSWVPLFLVFFIHSPTSHQAS